MGTNSWIHVFGGLRSQVIDIEGEQSSRESPNFRLNRDALYRIISEVPSSKSLPLNNKILLKSFVQIIQLLPHELTQTLNSFTLARTGPLRRSRRKGRAGIPPTHPCTSHCRSPSVRLYLVVRLWSDGSIVGWVVHGSSAVLV